MLLFVFFFGKFFWYYTAAQKAIHDATIYMARAPLADIQARSAEALALEIVTQETADFAPGTNTEPAIECGYKAGNSVRFRDCLTSGNPPVAVSASINLTVPNPFHFSLNGYSPLPEINVFIGLEMPYAGK